MQDLEQVTSFLSSLTAISPTQYQIWDSKGKMVFSTEESEADFLTTSSHMKMAKKVILSGQFDYTPLDPSRFICGIPVEVDSNSTAALLAFGPRPPSANAGGHPNQMNGYFEQILKFVRNGDHNGGNRSKARPDQQDHNFQDLYLFANISKQFRSLRLKQPVMGKLMYRILDHMDTDAVFLQLTEMSQYNLLEIRSNLVEQNGDATDLKDQYQQLITTAVQNCTGNYCIINDSKENPAFEGLLNDAFGFLAVAVRHLKTTYGWLGLISHAPKEEFKPEVLNILQTLANQIAAMVANMEQHDELEKFTVNIVCSLVNAIESKDAFVQGHSKRVHRYAMQMARSLKLPEEEMEALKWAALLHDIGKIGIPERILCKPGKLTEKEFHLIMQHPEKGREILSPIRQLAPSMEAIAHHHEKFNGKGYPKGLKGEEIPLAARIIAVADTFDALTSQRSYHQTKEPAAAMQVLEQVAGIQLDPYLVKVFHTAFRQENGMLRKR